MKKQKLLGLIRELMSAIGAGLVTHGLMTNTHMEYFLGFFMVLASLMFAIYEKQGQEIVFTLVRKLMSSAGGVVIALGILTPDKIESLLGIVGPLIALTWSVKSKGGEVPKSLKAIALLLVCVFMIPSCANLTADLGSDPNDGEIRSPITGIVTRETADGGTKAVIDSGTAFKWAGWLLRLADGESVRDIAHPIIEGSK